MIKTRKANMFDHTKIILLLNEWFHESQVILGYDHIASTWLSEMITSPTSMVMIAEYGEHIIGCIGIRQTIMPWNSQGVFLISDFIMTDKDFRDKGVASKLLNAVKQIADETKMTLLIGHASGTNPELKDRYFKMHGFKHLGSNFSYKGE